MSGKKEIQPKYFDRFFPLLTMMPYCSKFLNSFLTLNIFSPTLNILKKVGEEKTSEAQSEKNLQIEIKVFITSYFNC